MFACLQFRQLQMFAYFCRPVQLLFVTKLTFITTFFVCSSELTPRLPNYCFRQFTDLPFPVSTTKGEGVTRIEKGNSDPTVVNYNGVSQLGSKRERMSNGPSLMQYSTNSCPSSITSQPSAPAQTRPRHSGTPRLQSRNWRVFCVALYGGIVLWLFCFSHINVFRVWYLVNCCCCYQ